MRLARDLAPESTLPRGMAFMTLREENMAWIALEENCVQDSDKSGRDSCEDPSHGGFVGRSFWKYMRSHCECIWSHSVRDSRSLS